jgi:hypothetical protein
VPFHRVDAVSNDDVPRDPKCSPAPDALVRAAEHAFALQARRHLAHQPRAVIPCVAEVMQRKVAQREVAQHRRYVACITHMCVHGHVHLTRAPMQFRDGELRAVDPKIAGTPAALWQITPPATREIENVAMCDSTGRETRGVADVRVLSCPVTRSKRRALARGTLCCAVVVRYRGHRVYKESRRALNGHLRQHGVALL